MDRRGRDETAHLLEEIHAQQQRTAAGVERVAELLESQARESRERVERSLEMQRIAVQRQRTTMIIAVPLAALCLALIVYLVVRYL